MSLTLISPESELVSGQSFELELLYDQPVVVEGGAQSLGISLTVNTTLGAIRTHAPLRSHSDRTLNFSHQILGSYQDFGGIQLNGQIDRRFESIKIRSVSLPDVEASYTSRVIAGRLNITTPCLLYTSPSPRD